MYMHIEILIHTHKIVFIFVVMVIYANNKAIMVINIITIIVLSMLSYVYIVLFGYRSIHSLEFKGNVSCEKRTTAW